MGTKASLYEAFLTQEGFRPTESSGLLIFKREGRTYVLTVDENDEQYFQVIFPNFWSLDSDKERARAYQAANDSTSATKVAKVYVTNDGKSVWASAEMFFEKPEHFQPVFNRTISALTTAVANFIERMK